ncbi:hypothetical protein [Pseudoalteromonas luteoviolacea]|nr:hypothetical protein [Pseudoalteromonas luteoviolacea]
MFSEVTLISLLAIPVISLLLAYFSIETVKVISQKWFMGRV